MGVESGMALTGEAAGRLRDNATGKRSTT